VSFWNYKSFLAAVAVIGLASGAGAQDDGGPVVLTVTGLAEEHSFGIDDLRALETEVFSTTTIWTSGVQEFTGVPLAALLEALGVTEGEMIATAVNDYSVTFPVSEALADGPVVAYLRNGEPMSVRDKGPLWIVYPYDASEDFQSEIVHSRSIWQLNRIAFRAE